jgi:N-acetylglutamate synthase-like GNAT family acetyltransferase
MSKLKQEAVEAYGAAMNKALNIIGYFSKNFSIALLLVFVAPICAQENDDELRFSLHQFVEQAAGGFKQIPMHRLVAIDAQGSEVGRAEMPEENPCWLSNLAVKEEYRGNKYSLAIWNAYLARAAYFKCAKITILAEPGTYWYFHRLGARKVPDSRNSDQAFSGRNVMQYELKQGAENR